MSGAATSDGSLVWLSQYDSGPHGTLPAVFAVTREALIVGDLDLRRPDEVLARLQGAPDLSTEMGRRRLRIPLASIRRLARSSQRGRLEIGYQDGSRPRTWEIFSPAGSEIFDVVRTRIAPASPTRTERVPISQVTPSPRELIALFLALIGGAAMFFWEESSAPQTNPMIGWLYELGRTLGPVGRPIAGGMAVVLGLGWIAWSLKDRPMREVLEVR